MSNPKRKVTDLLPSEAILISSDAERDAVLRLFQEAGMKWINGQYPMFYKPIWAYPYAIHLLDNELAWQRRVEESYIPATDFIPTESDEVDKFDLSKLTRYDLGYCSGDDGVCTAEMVKSDDGDGDYVLWSDIEQLLKTRNAPNQ